MSIPTGTSTCCRHYVSLWTKKNGDTGNHQNLPPTRVVGYLFSSQGFLVPYINTGTVQEISEISCIRSDIPVQGTAFRFVHSTHGVYSDSKGGETDGHTQGYKNPPVPRPLVGESQVPPSLSPAYTGFSENVSGPRLVGKFGQIRTGTQAGFRPCRLPVRPQVRSGPTHTGPDAEPSNNNSDTAIPTGLSSLSVHVFDRSAYSHRETSSSRSTAYETHTVASQKQLENS